MEANDKLLLGVTPEVARHLVIELTSDEKSRACPLCEEFVGEAQAALDAAKEADEGT